MALLLRAALLLLATAPLFVASGFQVPLWQIVLAAVAGSALGQLAVRVTRGRSRAGWSVLAGTLILLCGCLAFLVHPAPGPALGRRLIVVSKGLTLDDAEALRGLPEVAAIAPLQRENAQLVGEDLNWSTHVLGTEPAFFEVRGWRLARGAAFSAEDLESAAKVLVLGETAARALFGAAEPLGQTVRIKGVPFTVVGVLARSGREVDDDVALLPLTRFRRGLFPSLPRLFPGQLWILPRSGASTEPIRALLRDRHHLPPDGGDDFLLRDLQ